ncbi:DedA family protein [Bacillus sp. DJP31]|uniref:DedA family protein n=1 Tax=Bacillus sp. DJP31 TaxID=3409789 RepID=UPI003BB63C7B
MDLETAFTFVDQYGYFALFLILWIGFFGIPVPNEVIVMTSGFVTSKGLLATMPAFLVTYCGVVMSLTTLYVLGRFFFFPLQKRFLHRPKYQQHILKASQLIEKYGPMALVAGYCLPGVRHFVPFMTGSTKMAYRTFAIYAYVTAAVWTSLFFFLGFTFGNQMDVILKNIYMAGIPLVLVIVLILFVFNWRRNKSNKMK